MSFLKRFTRKKKSNQTPSLSTSPGHKRYQFTLTIHSITSIDTKENSSYAVFYQRGRKNGQTKFQHPEHLNSDFISFGGEELQFETSIRLLDEKQLKPKSVRLSVVEKSSASSKQKQAVKVKQNLSQFVPDLTASNDTNATFKKSISFPLKKWKGNTQAKLNLTIQSVLINDANSASMTESEISTLGAADPYVDFDDVEKQDEAEAAKEDPGVSEMVGGSTAAKDNVASSAAANSSSNVNGGATSGSLSSRTAGTLSARSNMDSARGNPQYEMVAQLLTTDYRFIKALYSSIDSEQAGQMAQVLTDLARGLGSSLRFADCLLKAEFKHCGETRSQILRLNSFVTKCIDRILRYSANSYLKQVVTPLLVELLEDDEADFAVDPSRFPSDMPTTQVDELIQFHSMQLQEWARKFADVLFSEENGRKLPALVRHMARTVMDQCADVSSLPTERILGHLLILRMFNPAISLPFTKGIITQEPNEKQKHNLIMISKILQHISNHTLFNEKQPEAEELNEVVEEYFDSCDQFLRHACASKSEYDMDIVKANKKMDAAMQKRVVTNSVELKLNISLIVETIQKFKQELITNYNCTEEQLDDMLRTGIPVHSDPQESIKVDVASVRRLYKKKKWTTAKSQLQALDNKYANADEKIRFELSVLWSTLFNNRCLHYVKQKNGKKASAYAEDALRYLMRHDKQLYADMGRSLVYNAVYFNAQSTLASFNLSVGNVERAVKCMILAHETLQDNEELKKFLVPDVLRLWFLEAIKVYTYASGAENDDSVDISEEEREAIQEKVQEPLQNLTTLMGACEYKPSERVEHLLSQVVAASA